VEESEREMTIKRYNGWVKIGETLYPVDVDDLEIATVVLPHDLEINAPSNTTVSIEPQELYIRAAHENYVAPEYTYKAPPLEMTDDDAFDLMDSIRKEISEKI
jgi:hypothetical protein